MADFLPDVALATGHGDNSISLRTWTPGATVLICLHSSQCAACREYLQRLRPNVHDFEVWDARLLIVVPDAGTRFDPPFGTVVLDPDHHVSAAGDAAVIVADRYGHVFHASHAGPTHALPEPRELVEWLKYLGTLCPE